MVVYCSSKEVVIEVDGDVHAEKERIIKDKERESYLKNLGLRIIRYTNNEILREIDNVMADLFNKLS